MIWIIGSSSDYSKAVANEFVNVKTFGRHNIDYKQPFDKFIAKQKEMPNKIFINIRAEQDFAVDIDSSDKAYKKMLEDFLPIWLWKIRLYSYFYKQKIECTICEVTSSITYWTYRHKQNMPYASLRSISQQTALAHNTDILTVFQVSPDNITKDNTILYAKKTADWMNNSRQVANKIVELEGNTIL